MKTEVKEEEAAPSHNISASGYNAPPSNYSSSISGYNTSASSYNAPPSGYNTSDSYQPWQQQQQQQPPQQGHKRTFEDSRGRGYYEYREDKRYVQRRIWGTYVVHLACFIFSKTAPERNWAQRCPWGQDLFWKHLGFCQRHSTIFTSIYFAVLAMALDFTKL